MVSYYNLSMYPKNHASNLPYSPSPSWYAGNYHHQPPNQFLGDSETPPQTMYYPHPHHMFQSSPDWAPHENFAGPPQSTILQSNSGGGVGGGGGIGGGGNGVGPVHLNQNGNGNEHLNEGISSLPSPPITVSGSEMSSPGAPNGSASPQISVRPAPAKSPYEWMKKTSYQNQPNPGVINICSAPSMQDFTPLDQCDRRNNNNSLDEKYEEEDSSEYNNQSCEKIGKTRTKDKYRVVYSDHQRLELEKEYHTSRYITIRRKTELAQFLQLSERQVKIWFQNRRAKERKQTKKRDDPSVTSVTQQHPSILDVKPKLEPGFHPALHQMSAMSMGMNSMGLHHHHHALHSHLSVPTSQHLHQATQQMLQDYRPMHLA